MKGAHTFRLIEAMERRVLMAADAGLTVFEPVQRRVFSKNPGMRALIDFVPRELRKQYEYQKAGIGS